MTGLSSFAPPRHWAHLPFFSRAWPDIQDRLQIETRPVLPPAPQIFAALEACPPTQVRVVILGQDPYPTPGHAHGLAFSVAPDVAPLPRSLNNIFKEMQSDLGKTPRTGDLRFWAQQGVLLLNTALTVPAGTPGGHAKLGWTALTRDVLTELSSRPRAFVFWGRPAQSFRPLVTGSAHLIVETAHPSPLSANKGFFGSRPFSRVNDWLKAEGQTPINWTNQ